MRLKLTVHAQERIAERRINTDDIKRVIQFPDKKRPGLQEIKAQKSFGKKTLVVVYSREEFRDKHDEFLVITAYYLK
jgi:hypothetical protein